MTVRTKFFGALIAAAALPFLLTGCTDFEQFRSEPVVTQTQSATTSLMSHAEGRDHTEVKKNPLTVTADPWAGERSMRLSRGQPLPRSLEGAKSVTLITAQSMGLRDLSAQISSLTGIPVRLANDALGETSQAVTPATTSFSSDETSAALQALAGMSTPGGMSVSYEGPLTPLLDLIAGHFGVSWRYDGSSIQFFRYETRTFVMEALPGTQSVSDGLEETEENSTSGSSSSVGGSSSSQKTLTQSSKLDAEVKFWDEISGTVQSLLAGEGTLAVAPSSGTVTVTTTPERMRAVADYLNKENSRLGRQVAINIEVYRVELNDDRDFGMDLERLLYTAAGDGVSFGVTGPDVAIAGSGNISANIVSGGVTSDMFFRALSQAGQTSVITRAPVTTLNNRPASRKITTDRAFLQSISTQIVEGGGATTTLTPGSVTKGITMQLLPRILDDGRILLQYSILMTDFDPTFDTFASGGNSIQLPTTFNRGFVQQAVLRSSSTLVLAGYEENTDSGSGSGLGSAMNFLMGSRTDRSSRSMLVMAITPREVTPASGIVGAN